jgi:hypothetical protein
MEPMLTESRGRVCSVRGHSGTATGLRRSSNSTAQRAGHMCGGMSFNGVAIQPRVCACRGVTYGCTRPCWIGAGCGARVACLRR